MEDKQINNADVSKIITDPKAKAQIRMNTDGNLVQKNADQVTETNRFSDTIYGAGETGSENKISNSVTHSVAVLQNGQIPLSVDSQLESSCKSSTADSMDGGPTKNIPCSLVDVAGEEKEKKLILEPKQNTHLKIEDRLTELEGQQLVGYEKLLKSYLRNFVTVGNALRMIRNKRLYRTEFNSFESYCRAKWKLTKTTANRQIYAALFIGKLKPIGVKEPVSESQVRSLARLTDSDAVSVWKQAVVQAGADQPTAKQVSALAVKLFPHQAGVNKGTESFKVDKIIAHLGRFMEKKLKLASASERKVAWLEIMDYVSKKVG